MCGSAALTCDQINDADSPPKFFSESEKSAYRGLLLQIYLQLMVWMSGEEQGLESSDKRNVRACL